jgi:hypothetical protein
MSIDPSAAQPVVAPRRTVRVNLLNDDYDVLCQTVAGDDQRVRAGWQSLGDALAHRAGWHVDLDVTDADAPLLWSLGIFDASRLNIHVTRDGDYSCFDYDADTSVALSALPDVEDWLSTREDEAKKPSALQLDWARADDWNLFKTHRHVLRVTWSDGYYSGSLSTVNDASFGATLSEVINNATQMLCDLFEAPRDLAQVLNIAVELDEHAAAKVRA